MLKVFFKFFNPLHHCFTFPDYQLVPTMEEFSHLFGVPILNQLPFNGMERDPKPEDIAQDLFLQWSDVVVNWETRRAVQRFLVKFLFEKAQYFWGNWIYKLFKRCWPFSSMGWYYSLT